MIGESRASDDLRAKLLTSGTALFNLRSAETTAHPFLVTELVVIKRGIVVRRVKLAGNR